MSIDKRTEKDRHRKIEIKWGGDTLSLKLKNGTLGFSGREEEPCLALPQCFSRHHSLITAQVPYRSSFLIFPSLILSLVYSLLKRDEFREQDNGSICGFLKPTNFRRGRYTARVGPTAGQKALKDIPANQPLVYNRRHINIIKENEVTD